MAAAAIAIAGAVFVQRNDYVSLVNQLLPSASSPPLSSPSPSSMSRAIISMLCTSTAALSVGWAIYVVYKRFLLPSIVGGKIKLSESVVCLLPPPTHKSRATRDFVRFYTSPSPLLFLAIGSPPSPSTITSAEEVDDGSEDTDDTDDSGTSRDVDENGYSSSRKHHLKHQLIPLRPSSPTPNGDFNPEVIKRHFQEFKETLGNHLSKSNVHLSDEGWSTLMRLLSVNSMIEIMLAGNENHDDIIRALYDEKKGPRREIRKDHFQIWPSRAQLHRQSKKTSKESAAKILNLMFPCFVITLIPPRGVDPGCLRVVTYAKAKTELCNAPESNYKHTSTGWVHQRGNSDDRGHYMILRVWSEGLVSSAAHSAIESPIEPSSSRRFKREILSVPSFLTVEEVAKREMATLFQYQRPEILLAVRHGLSRTTVRNIPEIVLLIAHFLGLHDRFHGPDYRA
eukprot:CAMPEP_0114514842 /NCGR_PEP_ID=MMETSP0109-20121206/16383_1 /TAXON_ID=29199 /ORGANISM="Chlorarachnion reptans, Strain CCCM449" /LENGTH=452 /DNA_ID=CAMNT_0001694937 /DNA_START=119 /DNA_END=1477 /DNA_ORIENTATION=+